MSDKTAVLKTYFHPILIFGVFFSFWGIISRFGVVDLDIFHEMALFREAINLGKLPRHDLFSYIPTITPIIHHEWGTGALLYIIIVKFGLGSKGLILIKYLLTIFIAAGCYKFAIRQGGNAYIFSLLAFTAILLGDIGFTTIRAQLFTLFFLILFLFLIEQDRKGNELALFGLLPIFVLWANLHAGFIVGLGLFAIYIAERFLSDINKRKNFWVSFKDSKRNLLIFLTVCISLLINPYGYEYFPYLWNAVTLDRSELIPEWRPVWEVCTGHLFLYLVALSFILYSIVKKGWKNLPGLPILAATAYVSLLHYRHLSLFALVWICYAPSYVNDTPLGDLIKNTFKNNYKIISIFFLIVGIFGLSYSLKNHFWQLKIPTSHEKYKSGVPIYPSGAVDYLRRNNFSGNIMVPYSTGSFISWNLYPNVKVSMDSRFEVAYQYESVVENYNFYAAEKDWQNIPLKYETDAILVPNWTRVKKELMKNISKPNKVPFLKTWLQVYTDASYSIYMEPKIAVKYPTEDLGPVTIKGRFPYQNTFAKLKRPLKIN
jgi:hypothetical protein